MRIPARLTAYIEGERVERRAVTITDVSCLGCRMTSMQAVRVGSFVTLMVDGFMGFNAWVAWAHNEEFGLDFAHALPAAVVGRLTETRSESA